MKRVLLLASGIVMLVVAGMIVWTVNKYNSELPELIGLAEYKPQLVTEVFDRNNRKFGEFFREKRILTPYDKIPQHLVQAFVAAEDDTFFKHEGINLLAILRAFLPPLEYRY